MAYIIFVFQKVFTYAFSTQTHRYTGWKHGNGIGTIQAGEELYWKGPALGRRFDQKPPAAPPTQESL